MTRQNAEKRKDHSRGRANKSMTGTCSQPGKFISLDDLQVGLDIHGENFSVDMNALLDARNDKDILHFIVKNQIKIHSKANPDGAQLLRNIVEVTGESYKLHPDGNVKALKRATAAVKKNADEKAFELFAIIKEFESDGLDNDHAIAMALNKAEILTPRGKTNWQHVTVSRIRERMKKLKHK